MTDPTPRPLVSVIVPVYNHALYVEACLESVAAQDYEPVELVVVDDGSTDDSADRVAAWIAARPARFTRVVFERQANAGLVRTLNRLAELAEGEYLVALASDDVLLPGALFTRAALLGASPDALGVFTDCAVVGDDGAVVYESGIRGVFGGSPAVLERERFLLPSLLLQWCVPGSASILRREAFDPVLGVGPFDETLYPEDLNFYLRLALAERLRFTPTPTAGYRVHGSNSIQVATSQIAHGARSTLLALRASLPPYSRAIARLILAATDTDEAIWWRRPLRSVSASVTLKVVRAVHRFVVLRLPPSSARRSSAAA